MQFLKSLRISRSLFTLFSILFLISCPLEASLQLDVAKTEIQAVPVDELQRNLPFQNRSKEVRGLKLAYDALQEDHYSKAIRLASKVLKSQIYSDYAHWITASALRQEAAALIEKKNYSHAIESAKKAIPLFLQIESSSPYSTFIPALPRELAQVELLLGEINWGKKQWLLSQQGYERAFHRLIAKNLLSFVKIEHLDHYGEACSKKIGPYCENWLQKLASIFAKRPEEIKAILMYFPDLPEIPKTAKNTNRIVTLSYKAPDLDQAAFESIFKVYFEEKYSQAAQGFKKFLDDFPRSIYKPKVRFWLAQCLSHEQSHEKSQKIYEELQLETPLSYLGLLSANALGKPIDISINANLPLATDSDLSLAPKEIIQLKKAKSFLAEDVPELAAHELRDLRPRDTFSSSFLMYMAMLNYKARNYSTSFLYLGELIQRGYEGVFSNYSLRMIFPVDYFNLIQRHSEENSLDPILVLSLIKQESAFDEDVNSSAGALGLMQLMPATALDVDPSVKLSHLLKAEENIRVGTRYLRKLMVRFNGNIVFALAGYNAGPNAVDRWIRDSGGKKAMLEFIESIPYRETREYVAAIIRNYFWYSKRLGNTNPPKIDYFWNVYGPPESPPKLPTGGKT